MKVLYFITLSFALIIILISLIRRNRLNPLIFRILPVVIVSLLTECAAAITEQLNGSNQIVYHIADSFEYAAFVWFYAGLLVNSTVKKAFFVSVGVVTISSVINSLFIQPPPFTETNIIVLKSALITAMALFYIYEQLQAISLNSDKGFFLFVINAGILFHYSFSTIYWSIFNYLINRPNHLMKLIELHPVLICIYIIMLLCIMISVVFANTRLNDTIKPK